MLARYSGNCIRTFPTAPTTAVIRTTTCSFSRRCFLTQVVDPPIQPDVPERPHTIIFAQDDNKEFLTNDHVGIQKHCLVQGFSFASLKLESENMDDALRELATDLETTPSPVVISRGPFISWLFQFYLESLSLSGLVMINPILFDSADALAIRFVEEGLESPTASLFDDYVNHWDHWSLRLEPGSIPMMVLSTRAELEQASRQVVERHGGEESVVFSKLYDMDLFGENEDTNSAVGAVTEWIDRSIF